MTDALGMADDLPASSIKRHGSFNLHTVFTSECHNTQFDWFATGVYESFRNAGMQGSITRLLACTQEDLKHYKGLDLGPTFVHPNYRNNPINGDVSASYNKVPSSAGRSCVCAAAAPSTSPRTAHTHECGRRFLIH